MKTIYLDEQFESFLESGKNLLSKDDEYNNYVYYDETNLLDVISAKMLLDLGADKNGSIFTYYFESNPEIDSNGIFCLIYTKNDIEIKLVGCHCLTTPPKKTLQQFVEMREGDVIEEFQNIGGDKYKMVAEKALFGDYYRYFISRFEILYTYWKVNFYISSFFISGKEFLIKDIFYKEL